VTINAINFNCTGKIGSVIGDIIDQLRIDPPIIAPALRAIAGVVRSLLTLDKLCRGRLLCDDQILEIIIRVEYAEVKVVAEKIIKRIKMLDGLNNNISRIKSFE
jgi:hypothetical protein